jgi:uncharacterized alkaline shock family protein YloU
MTAPSGQGSPASRLLVDDQLACGANVDELFEQVADGDAENLTSHQQHCPHCQAAIREFTSLWAPVRELAATPVPAPAELTTAVMNRVRRLVKDVWYTLDVTDLGAIRIAARIVATLARDTARLVPGVRVALGRSTQAKLAELVEKATLGHRHPHSAVGVLGRTAVVDLALAVQYGPPIHDIAHEVQQRVIAALRAGVGLQDVTVNIHVDDVLPSPDSET